MADLSHLSDDQLQQIAGGQPDLSHLSDSDLAQIANPQSLGQRMIGYGKTALKAINSVTIDPVDAGIYASQTGKPVWDAVKNQFANMDGTGPTGADIGAKLGFSTQRPSPYDPEFGYTPGPGNVPPTNHPVSPAQAYGMAHDLVANPLNYIGPAVGALGKVAEFWKPATEAAETLSATGSQAQKASAAADATSSASANISSGPLEVEQSGKLFSTKAPQSLDELRNWTPTNNDSSVVGKARMQQIVQDVPDIQTQPLQYHYDMMDNPKAMKALKLQFENLPSSDAMKIAAYNQQMVNEAGQKAVSTVNDISQTPPMSLSDAGDNFISTVKDQYNAEKTALGPAFDELNSSSSRLPRAQTQDLAQAIGANTKFGSLMSADPETGKLFLANNSPRSGLSDPEYSVMSRVVDDMNNGMTFKDIQNTRDFIRKSIDPANPGASAELGKVRSILLDQLGNMADAKGPNVSDTFKAYAINERARESVEKVIGGKIDSLDSMYAANPERVVNKIFSNPNYAKTVGAYVGPDKMNDMAAAYVNKGVSSAYDSVNGFNPSKLRGWLKANNGFMQNYVNPETTKRLNALADYGYLGKRFLDEVNPSGTAASLEAMLKPEGFVQKVKHGGIVGALETEASSRVNSFLKQRQAIKVINKAMSPQTTAASGSSFVNPMANMSPVTGPAASAVMQLSRPQNNGGQPMAQQLPSRPMPQQMPPQQAPQQMSPAPNQAMPPQQAPTKTAANGGPTKWAADGFQGLKDHVNDMDKQWLDDNKAKLMIDPKAQNLLISASSFPPGSKPLDDIMKHLKGRLK